MSKTIQEVLTCESCGKQDNTVHHRICGYDKDVNNSIVWETVCDACEHEHIMDI